MFGKKKTPPQQTNRNVRYQQSAPVFSYHSSRSASEASERRAEPAQRPKTRRINASTMFAYLPSFIAGLALILCLGYMSTLSSQPRLVVVDNPDRSLLAGNDTYESGIAEIMGTSVANQSKLLINADELAKKISDRYPELGNVTVVLPLAGRRPIVQVRPTEPGLILVTRTETFAIDRDGRTLAVASDVPSSIRDNLPVVQDESGVEVNLGGYAMLGDNVMFVRQVNAQLRAGGLKVRNMTMPVTANELHVRLDGSDYYAKFNLRGDARLQSGGLIATKKKLDREGAKPKEYIDVRVPGKAYYK